MQKWTRRYDYNNEYLNLVLKYYSKHAVAFPVTYWNFDNENSIYDNEKLDGGPYKFVSNTLSGWRWTKILLLPVYFIDQMNLVWSAEDRGYIYSSRMETNIVIPSEYGITPVVHDYVKFEQSFVRPTNNVAPILVVRNIEDNNFGEHNFYKLTLTLEGHVRDIDLDVQSTSTNVFVDYTKTIHSLSVAEALLRMLEKNRIVVERLAEEVDVTTGFYFQ